jgi:acetolactate synthase-1/3 small subunit
MLIKLRAPAGPARTEVLQLAEIFRARVVDVSERGITLCVSGDPGKVSTALV